MDRLTGMYAGDFIKHWGVWMSGIVSVFFGAWVLFFEPRNETVKSAFIWTAIICAVLTFYQLWANEHRKYLAEKAKGDTNVLNRKINGAHHYARSSSLHSNLCLLAVCHYEAIADSALIKFHRNMIEERLDGSGAKIA